MLLLFVQTKRSSSGTKARPWWCVSEERLAVAHSTSDGEV
jgi:hypothetical protein